MRRFVPALACLLWLCACASDERYDPVVVQVVAQSTREYVQESVPDRARAEAMLLLIERCEALALELDRQQQALLAQLEQRNAEPDIATEELRALHERALAARKETSMQLYAAYLRMREIARPEEWERIMMLEGNGLRASLRRERNHGQRGGGA